MSQNSSMEFGQKPAVHKTALTILVLSFGFFINVIVNIVLARWLSVATFGDYAIIRSVVNIAAPLVLLGASLSSVKFLPNYLSSSDWGRAKGYMHFYLVIAAVILIVLLTMTIVLLLIIHAGKWQFSELKLHPFVISLWLVPLAAIILFLSKVLVSLQRPVLSALPIGVFLPVLFLGLCVGSYFVFDSFNIGIVVLAFAAASILTICYLLIKLYFLLPKELWLVKSEYHVKAWLSTGLALMFYLFFLQLLIESDLIMLEILDPGEKVVGVFAAIVSVSSIVWIVYTSIVTVVSPKISIAVKNNDVQSLLRVYRSASITNACISVPLVILFVVFAKQILLLFGQHYVIGVTEFRMVVIATMVSTLFCLSIPTLQYAGYHNELMRAMSLVFILSILLNLILIPLFGLMGAAVSLTITRPLIVFYATYLMRRKVLSLN